MVNTKAMVIRAAAFFAVVALTAVGAFVLMIDSDAYSATDPYTAPLYAGQNILVGEVQIWNTQTTTGHPDDLYVKFVITDDDWKITEIHLEMALTLSGIPQKNGNPIPGQFSIKETFDPAVSSAGPYTFDVSGTNYPAGTKVIIAAHAVVETDNGENGEYQQETSWGGENDFPGKNWATYIEFWLEGGSNNGGDKTYQQETAWGAFWNDANNDGKIQDSERSYDFSGSNWALYVTFTKGSSTRSTYQLIAGQYTDVGKVEAWQTGSTLYVKFTTESWTASGKTYGCDIFETHVAIGDAVSDIPQKNGNPIPGQFSEKATYTEPFPTTSQFSFDISGYSTGTTIYIAAHASVGIYVSS